MNGSKGHIQIRARYSAIDIIHSFIVNSVPLEQARVGNAIKHGPTKMMASGSDTAERNAKRSAFDYRSSAKVNTGVWKSHYYKNRK